MRKPAVRGLILIFQLMTYDILLRMQEAQADHLKMAVLEVVEELAHPEELEVPPENVKYDKGVEYHVEKLNKG